MTQLANSKCEDELRRKAILCGVVGQALEYFGRSDMPERATHRNVGGLADVETVRDGDWLVFRVRPYRRWRQQHDQDSVASVVEQHPACSMRGCLQPYPPTKPSKSDGYPPDAA